MTTDPSREPLAYQTHPLTPADQSHLSTLAICYWVWGGLIALMSLFGMLYIAMGIAFVSGAFSTATTQASAQPPPALGWIFVAVGIAVVFFGQALGWLNIYVGFSLKKQRHWLFCVIVAAFNCISIPIGTLLGIFTFIVLNRPAVKATFKANPT